MKTFTRRCRAGALALLSAAVGAAPPAAPTGGEWTFQARLDGKPIGEHRFKLSAEGDSRRVVSEATFAVKFLGITAYRYKHSATEQWRGDCLVGLAASTDDGGKLSRVQADPEGDALGVVSSGSGSSAGQTLKGCVMSFAYWNPAIRARTQLLNAQTGQYESVQVGRVGSGSIEVRGQPVAAEQFRITGAAQPIDLWYSAQGEWLGLDSTLAGGRKLSYRLQ